MTVKKTVRQVFCLEIPLFYKATVCPVKFYHTYKKGVDNSEGEKKS